MEIGLHKQDYGSFCLSHSKRYGGKTIDKLTFTVPKSYFRKNIFQYKEKVRNDVFYIEHCNNQFYKLHIHGEYINPLIPMIDSVMDIFFEISSHGIFLNSINQQIQKALERCNILNSYYRFILFLRTRGFRFSELELAFDFFECMPFIGIKHSAFKKYKNSIYSSDRKIYYRKSFTEDDSYGLEKHRVRDSVFAIYNRGIKLQVPESVWRVEWRLRDERARRLLDMTDLRLNMDNYICKYSHRLRNILGNWIGPNEIVFNWDYINYSFPIFSLLTTG